MVDRHRASRLFLDAAFAFAVDGSLLLNAAHALDPDDAEQLVREALATYGEVFIGVPLRRRDRAKALRRLANGAADAAGHVVGQRRRRDSVRSSGRRDS